MAEQVLVVEEDLKHLLFETQKYQEDITDLTKLYEVANTQNMQHMEELKAAQTSLAEVEAENKSFKEENESFKELLRARDEELLVLQQQIVKLAEQNANLDTTALIGLISPTEGKDLNEELEMIRQALNAKPQQESTNQTQQLTEQLFEKQKELDAALLECNRLKFEMEDARMPENAVIKQLEGRIQDENEQMTDLKKQILDNSGQAAALAEMQKLLDEANAELHLKQQEFVEKEADILQLIEEFEKLQDDNQELQEALENGVNFAHANAAVTVNELVQTDLAADNAVLEFESDFELMLEELEEDIALQSTSEMTQMCELLSKGTQRYITRGDVFTELQRLLDEWAQLKNNTDALQLSGYRAASHEGEKDVLIMRLEDENEVAAKQIEALKDDVEREIDQVAMRGREVADLKDNIVQLNQQITARDVTIQNQISKLQEQERILQETRSKLQQFEVVSEQLEKTQLATEEEEKLIPQLKQQKEGLQLLLDEAKERTAEAEGISTGLLTKIAALEAQIEDLTRQLTANEAQLRDNEFKQQQQLEEQTLKLKNYETETEQLRREEEELEEQYRQVVRENEQIKTTALRNENSIQEQQNMLAETNTASVSYQQLSEELKQENKIAEIEIEKLRNDKEELLLKISDLKLHKNELENDMKMEQEQSKQATIELQNENQILQTQNGDFKHVLAQKNTEISELELELRKQETEVKEAHIMAKKAAAEQKEQLQELTTQIANMQKKVDEQDDNISKHTQKITQLTDTLAVKEAAIAEEQVQIAQFEEQLVKHENEVKNLELELERANHEKKRFEQDLQRTELEINQREENFLEQTQLIKTKYEDFTQKQLDREIQKREADIVRLKESLDRCEAELSMAGIELEKTRNELKMAHNDMETLNVKIAEEEELNQRIRQNAAELKREHEEKLAALENELSQLNQRFSQKEMQAKLDEAQRTAAVRDEYTTQTNELVQQIKDLQLENEKMKVQKQMEAVDRGKYSQEIEILKQKLIDTEAGFNQQVKSAEKYKELYKKAYEVVDKLKARESESKKVINDLEERVKAIESRKLEQQPELREKWGEGAW